MAEGICRAICARLAGPRVLGEGWSLASVSSVVEPSELRLGVHPGGGDGLRGSLRPPSPVPRPRRWSPGRGQSGFSSSMPLTHIRIASMVLRDPNEFHEFHLARSS